MSINKKTSARLRIEEIGIIPAIRPVISGAAADDARFAAETVNNAGIPIAEISMTATDAIDVISHLTRNFPRMIVGADVLDLETACRCVDAGARFLTSPGLLLDVVEFALKKDIVAIPGALTPTEVITAWKAGADFVKVFPCAAVGGARYIKSLKTSMQDAPLIASGGVTQQTAGDFILAGATALGIGGELIPQEALHSRKDEQIRELARRFLGMVKAVRTERMARS
jgi:2-dehydro-3-deoxyphosphogluconate aldolase/(4S)-4-hydroxy-2-oxoglutarate aldolase